MVNKRILLMYISEVSGHRSAAMAVEKAIKTIAPETEILSINAFGYTNPIAEKIINRIYMGVIQRFPKIWEYLYDNQKLIKRFERIKSFINRANSLKLKKLFDEFKPDVVACTQAFPCGMVADFKKRHKSDLKLVAILTDYIPHSYWIYEAIDCYISPSDEVALKMMDKGVAQDKIKVLGIPFDSKFNRDINKDVTRAQLKINKDLPLLLIMGGGHGLGPINEIVTSLEKTGLPLQEIIVTGINKRLYQSLNKEIRGYKNKISLMGYVDNINELMSIADIVITKPGGITTAEALTKQLPMVIIKPIPGQEANNTAYLMRKNAAVKADRPHEIHLIIKDLLNNPGKLAQMRLAAGQISKPNSSIDIAKMLLNLE